MPADEEYDENWAPGNPVLRGAGRKEVGPDLTPGHRMRADELPHRLRVNFGLANEDPDPVEFVDELEGEELGEAARGRAGAAEPTEDRRGAARPGRLTGVPFVAARKENFAVGRQGYADTWFVLHCTDDDYSNNYPDNLGKYWGREVTKVSVHFGVSDTMTRQYVDMNNTAYQARNPANLRGVGVELSGLSRWTRAQWLAHRPMIRRAAQLCIDVSRVRGYGSPTGQLLIRSALQSRGLGTTQHRDLTATFGGSHTDLGPNFPWDAFAAEIKALSNPSAPVNKPPAPKPVTPKENDVATLTSTMVDRWKVQLDAIADVVHGGKGNAYKNSVLQRDLRQVVATLSGQIAGMGEVIRTLAGDEPVDLAAVERVAYNGARRALEEFSAQDK